MEVFALTFYLCATISASGISEQKCTWKTEDYYNEKEACIEKAKTILEADDVEQVACTLVKVL